MTYKMALMQSMSFFRFCFKCFAIHFSVSVSSHTFFFFFFEEASAAVKLGQAHGKMKLELQAERVVKDFDRIFAIKGAAHSMLHFHV